MSERDYFIVVVWVSKITAPDVVSKAFFVVCWGISETMDFVIVSEVV